MPVTELSHLTASFDVLLRSRGFRRLIIEFYTKSLDLFYERLLSKVDGTRNVSTVEGVIVAGFKPSSRDSSNAFAASVNGTLILSLNFMPPAS